MRFYNLVMITWFVGGLGEKPYGSDFCSISVGTGRCGAGTDVLGTAPLLICPSCWGRGREIRQTGWPVRQYTASVLTYAVLIFGAAIFLRPILAVLGATDTIMPYALSYGRIYIISCIFNVFNVTMNNIVASEGAAKTTMCALLLGAIVNIRLDPVFIYGPGTWGCRRRSCHRNISVCVHRSLSGVYT